MTKPCVKCGHDKRNGKGECMACARAAARDWRTRHPYRTRVPSGNACVTCHGTERYKNGDCKACAIKRSAVAHHKRKISPGGDQYQRQKTQQARLSKYGLSQEALTSLLVEYGGLCAICREAKATHIDHDHVTGCVRGVLCHQCNIGLGCFKDSLDRLSRAAIYLGMAAVSYENTADSRFDSESATGAGTGGDYSMSSLRTRRSPCA